MRALFWLSLLLILPGALIALLAVMATSSTPSVPAAAALDLRDVARGREVLAALGLKSLREGESRAVQLSAADLEKALNAALTRTGLGAARVSMTERALNIEASLRLPGVPRYLNAQLGLRPHGALLEPADLRLGSVPLPAQGTSRLLLALLAASPYASQAAAVRDMLRAATLVGRDDYTRLVLDFVWHGAAVQSALQAGAGLDLEALQAYRSALVSPPQGAFSHLLGQAFSLAQRRSQTGDAVRENRAALTVVAEIVLGTRLTPGLPAETRRPARKAAIRIGGRHDFAQHFALSAFLAATGGAGLSDLAGVYKELQDAQGGSGFSFNDLAADRAGSRLGEYAIASDAQARALQRQLAGQPASTLFFPRVDDLPEFMQQVEFERRYGGVGAPVYEVMQEKIEARIAALPLYR